MHASIDKNRFLYRNPGIYNSCSLAFTYLFCILIKAKIWILQRGGFSFLLCMAYRQITWQTPRCYTNTAEPETGNLLSGHAAELSPSKVPPPGRKGSSPSTEQEAAMGHTCWPLSGVGRRDSEREGGSGRPWSGPETRHQLRTEVLLLLEWPSRHKG